MIHLRNFSQFLIFRFNKLRQAPLNILDLQMWQKHFIGFVSFSISRLYRNYFQRRGDTKYLQRIRGYSCPRQEIYITCTILQSQTKIFLKLSIDQISRQNMPFRNCEITSCLSTLVLTRNCDRILELENKVTLLTRWSDQEYIMVYIVCIPTFM